MGITTGDALRAVARDQARTSWLGDMMFALGIVSALVGLCLLPEIFNPYFNDRLGDRLAVLMTSCLMIGGGLAAVAFKHRVDDIILTRKRARQWRVTFKRLNPDANLDALDRVVAHMQKNTGYVDITFERISNIFEHVTRFRTEPTQSIWVEAMQNYWHFHNGSQELAVTLCPK